jgi:ComF family protein
VWWLGEYKEPLKPMVLGFKYQRKRQSARTMGLYLADTLPFLDQSTIVTYVPTANRRVRQRGYDQARIIALAFAKKRNMPCQNLLIRVGNNELIGKKRADRIKSMQNAFVSNGKQRIRGADILIIDDVLTTGASLESAARVLREAGAVHVDAAVIARKLLS